jgi:hypothetical protein
MQTVLHGKARSASIVRKRVWRRNGVNQRKRAFRRGVAKLQRGFHGGPMCGCAGMPATSRFVVKLSGPHLFNLGLSQRTFRAHNFW